MKGIRFCSVSRLHKKLACNQSFHRTVHFLCIKEKKFCSLFSLLTLISPFFILCQSMFLYFYFGKQSYFHLVFHTLSNLKYFSNMSLSVSSGVPNSTKTKYKNCSFINVPLHTLANIRTHAFWCRER